jgi:hypothetical protein
MPCVKSVCQVLPSSCKVSPLFTVYLRNILRAHPKVGLKCVYIDGGRMPLRYHIKFRRIIYLWQILNLEKTDLVSRIFTSQKLVPKFGDWFKSVEKDKSDLLIDIDDSESIQKYNQNLSKVISLAILVVEKTKTDTTQICQERSWKSKE